MNNSITIDKDYANRKIRVTTKYHAPLDSIWDYFTNAEQLEKWWAPKPYLAITKKMDFTNGGYWLYYMLSPEGDKHWCIVSFKNIQPKNTYELANAFCDEEGNITPNFPRMDWANSFHEENGITTITNIISFETEAEMKQLLEMGFEGGYRMGLNQLDDLLGGKS